MKTRSRLCLMPLALLALAGCRQPEPAVPDRPPAPQATALRQAIEQPLDRAKAVEAGAAQGAEAQRAQIDAATQ